jgi:hypothetical protein
MNWIDRPIASVLLVCGAATFLMQFYRLVVGKKKAMVIDD